MEISREFGCPLQTHLSETADEVREIMRRTGLRPLNYLHSLGLADEGLIAVHAVHLDDEELDLLAEKGIKVVCAPESNMKLASGVARVPEMLKRGLAVGIGTDGCASNNNLDLFQEMDSAAKLYKVMEMDPVGMSAETVLKMASLWGARVLGLEDEVGTLEVGKKADIITLDMTNPHLVPLYNPFSTLVYSAGGSDVKDVVVNGRILMKDRVFRVMDPDEVMAKVREISRKIS